MPCFKVPNWFRSRALSLETCPQAADSALTGKFVGTKFSKLKVWRGAVMHFLGASYSELSSPRNGNFKDKLTKSCVATALEQLRVWASGTGMILLDHQDMLHAYRANCASMTAVQHSASPSRREPGSDTLWMRGWAADPS